MGGGGLFYFALALFVGLLCAALGAFTSAGEHRASMRARRLNRIRQALARRDGAFEDTQDNTLNPRKDP